MMELIETIFVFIGLKIKETVFFIGKWTGIIGGIFLLALLALGAIGGISIGIWYLFSSTSVDAQVLYKIRDFNGTSYFWAFTITSIIMGLFEMVGIIGGFCIITIGYQGFWNTINWLQYNWWKAKEIVMKRRSA